MSAGPLSMVVFKNYLSRIVVSIVLIMSYIVGEKN